MEVNSKCNLSLVMPRRHKGEAEVIALPIRYPGAGTGWVVSITPQSLYSQEGHPVLIYDLCPVPIV